MDRADGGDREPRDVPLNKVPGVLIAVDTVLALGRQGVAVASFGGNSFCGSYCWPEAKTP
jgi:hypothetical protein